MHYIIQFAKFI